MRAFTIHIYNPNTHTHALLNWVDYSSGNYSQGFCCLARFLSSAFTALACQQPHLARAANPELWWGGVSYLFGRAQTDLWIGARRRGEKEKPEERENGRPGMCRDGEVICHLLPLLLRLFSCLSLVALSVPLPLFLTLPVTLYLLNADHASIGLQLITSVITHILDDLIGERAYKSS